MFIFNPDEELQKNGFEAMDSRRRILFGAMELVALNGFEASSTRAIASKANLTIGMIWKIFGTKENLFREMDNHTEAVIVKCFESSTVIEASDVPRWIMNAGGEFSKNYTLEFCYFRRVLTENSPSYHRLLTAYYSQCEKHFRRLQDNTAIGESAPVEELSLATLFLAVGVLIGGPWLREQESNGELKKNTTASFQSYIEKMVSSSPRKAAQH